MANVVSLTGRELESKVLQEGPVVLDFYQASCPPCRTLEPRLERVAQEYVGWAPVYRVDIDCDLPVAQRFGVMSIPTVLVLRAGREVARLDGLSTEDDLRAAFHQATQECPTGFGVST